MLDDDYSSHLIVMMSCACCFCHWYTENSTDTDALAVYIPFHLRFNANARVQSKPQLQVRKRLELYYAFSIGFYLMLAQPLSPLLPHFFLFLVFHLSFCFYKKKKKLILWSRRARCDDDDDYAGKHRIWIFFILFGVCALLVFNSLNKSRYFVELPFKQNKKTKRTMARTNVNRRASCTRIRNTFSTTKRPTANAIAMCHAKSKRNRSMVGLDVDGHETTWWHSVVGDACVCVCVFGGGEERIRVRLK